MTPQSMKPASSRFDSCQQVSQGSLQASLRASRRQHALGFALRIAVLVIAVAGLWLVSLIYGDITYSFSEVMQVVAGQFSGETVPGASFSVGELRLPRATVAIAVGMAFGMAGVIFQTLLRNQLASPDIVGISSAASAAGVTAIVLAHAATAVVSLVSLVASLLVAALIYLLTVSAGGRWFRDCTNGSANGGRTNGRTNSTRSFSGPRLILIGIGIAAMLQSWTTYVLSRAAAWDLPTATRWLMGSLNNMTFERGWAVIVAVIIALPLALIFSHRLNILHLGDDLATSFGLRAGVLRAGLLACAVALIAIATAACGPVAFLAFMSGPIAARIFRPGSSLIIPSGLIGAVLLLAADLAGQHLFGTRYPVGVITGALGAPFLIYLLIRSR